MRLTFALFLLLASLQAAAQQRGAGVYAGISLGNFQLEEDHGPLSVDVPDRPLDDIIGSATPTISGRLDDSELSLKVYGGWNLNRNLGVEVSYGRANELTSAYTEQVGDLTVSASLATNIDIGTARVMGYLPFRLGAVFGGVGYFSAETSSTQNVRLVVSGVGGAQSPATLGGSATDKGPTAIVGFHWRLPILTVRADYELLEMNAGRAATLSVGVAVGL